MMQVQHWNNPCVFLTFLSLVGQLKHVLEVSGGIASERAK
jgi:hypothetical protein